MIHFMRVPWWRRSELILTFDNVSYGVSGMEYEGLGAQPMDSSQANNWWVFAEGQSSSSAASDWCSRSLAGEDW